MSATTDELDIKRSEEHEENEEKYEEQDDEENEEYWEDCEELIYEFMLKSTLRCYNHKVLRKIAELYSNKYEYNTSIRYIRAHIASGTFKSEIYDHVLREILPPKTNKTLQKKNSNLKNLKLHKK